MRRLRFISRGYSDARTNVQNFTDTTLKSRVRRQKCAANTRPVFNLVGCGTISLGVVLAFSAIGRTSSYATTAIPPSSQLFFRIRCAERARFVGARWLMVAIHFPALAGFSSCYRELAL